MKSFYKFALVLIQIICSCFLLSACHRFQKADSMELNNLIPPDDLSYNAKFYVGDLPYYDQTMIPMVVYASENGRIYYWLSLRPIGIYTSDRRATEVAGRLDRYRLEKMSNLSWGKLNKEQIICAYTEAKPNDCQLVVTVPPDIDVKQVLTLLQCKLKSLDDSKCSAPIKS